MKKDLLQNDAERNSRNKYSLLYKWFGSPQSLEEVEDRARLKREVISILWGRDSILCIPGTNYTIGVSVMSGVSNPVVPEYAEQLRQRRNWYGHIDSKDIQGLQWRAQALILTTAKHFIDKGLEVRINGKPYEEARIELQNYPPEPKSAFAALFLD